MAPSTLHSWSRGNEETRFDGARSKREPVITALNGCPGDRRSVPFIGLVEAGGDAVFVEGGGTLSAVASRAGAGEPLESLATDFGTPADQIEEALCAVWPTQAAA